MACPFDIAPAVLTNADAGYPFSELITASNGVAPYTFSVPSNAYGPLPLNGLTLTDNGDGTATLSGTPTSWSFVLTGIDNDTSDPSASIFSPCVMGTEVWTFFARLIGPCETRFLFKVNSNPPCNNSRTPDLIDMVNDSLLDIQNKLYAALDPFFVGKISFTVTAGDTDPCDADPSLRVMPVKILMEGIGTEYWTDPAGTFQIDRFTDTCRRESTTKSIGSSFDILVTDNNGCEVTQSYSIIPPCHDFTFSPSTFPGGTVGSAYSQSVTVTNTIPPTSFTLSGSLPDGLSFVDNGDGTFTISGTPTVPGTFPFSVQLDECLCNMGSFSITILAAPSSGRKKRKNGTFSICPPTIDVELPSGMIPLPYMRGKCWLYVNPIMVSTYSSMGVDMVVYRYTKQKK